MTDSNAKVLYTPLAEARWAYLIEPRPQMDPDKPLAWSVDLVFPAGDPKTIDFHKKLEDAFVAEHGTKKRRSDKGFPLKADKSDPDLLVCKFKAQQLVRRDGTTAPGPKLIDAKKQPWDGSAIGNGSKLIVAFKLHAWDRPEGCGISLIPRAAQVVHFVPYLEEDATEGFEEQAGGYTVPGVADEFDEFGDEL
jgi:hypothetical protein